MTFTARPWYPLLLLRDARGSFAQLRQKLTTPRPTRWRRQGRVQVDAVQLVLF